MTSSKKVSKRTAKPTQKSRQDKGAGRSKKQVRDSFENFITLMGTGKDKTQQTRPVFSGALSNHEIKSLMRSYLVRRILDMEGFWATRQGWSTKIDTGDAEQSGKLSKAYDEIHRK